MRVLAGLVALRLRDRSGGLVVLLGAAVGRGLDDGRRPPGGRGPGGFHLHAAAAVVGVLAVAPLVAPPTDVLRAPPHGRAGGADPRRGPGIPGGDQGYTFRYAGLKPVPEPRSGYLLLPADWSPSARPSILLPRSDSLRLEFVTARPGGAVRC